MSNLGSLSGRSENREHYAMWPWGLSFPMVKTRAAEVVWSNQRLPFEGGNEALLEEFAWNIPVDKASLSSGEPTKTFYAECYGGGGIQHNGGGVRCAWRGKWLVKGIGINILSGYSDEDASVYRKNGRASLSEILVEAIWGEVLQYALPYGAVRMTAVIKTGEMLNDPAPTIGGIGVREFVWRPAHFLRAPGFRVRPENSALIPSDTARVKEAIACLPHMLPMPITLSEQDIVNLEPLERLKIGLEEMVRRLAEQIATAQAKRLSHGTLSASNLSIDGRWNDLNSVSALPSYGYRRNMTPFWEDQFSLLETIKLICFYIGKYFPGISETQRESLPTASWLSSRYMGYYKDALSRRFVALCGYPQIVANRIWATHDGQIAMRGLSNQLLELARSGHSPRFPFDDEMQNNTVWGDYDLPKILREMTGSGSCGHVASLPEKPCVGPDILEAFGKHYRIVEKMMFEEAKRQGISAKSFARLVAVNCHKAGRNIPFLFRNVIFERCGMMVEQYQSLDELRREAGRLIQSVIDEARTVYQEPSDFKTLLWCMDEMTLEYDARSDCLVADIAGKRSMFPCNSTPASNDTSADVAPLLSSMMNYWGQAYEEIMQ